MKKRIATLAASLGLATALVVPMGGAAQAAECIGSSAIPASYVCIIRRELGTIRVTQGPIINTIPFCALVLCIDEQAIPLVDIAIEDDEVVVVYYNNRCYYIGNGTVTDGPPSAVPPAEPDCP